jgi:hypothetical protein
MVKIYLSQSNFELSGSYIPNNWKVHTEQKLTRQIIWSTLQ